MIIPGFSNYLFEDDQIVNLTTNKIVTWSTRLKTKHPFVKLKNDNGEWKQLSKQKVISLVLPVAPPIGHHKVPGVLGLWINRKGSVWSEPTTITPLGTYLTIQYSDDPQKYPHVGCKTGNWNVHQLLALTFIDPEYISKGLCVMHLDDDKNNFCLSNLKVGSYSENNKAAYDSGVNPSKKQ